MTVEDMGNAVKINDRIIPAVNIQVTNMPGLIDGEWYPLYFEIPDETGALLIVEVTLLLIEVQNYPFWDAGDQEFCLCATFYSWEQFLLYQNSRTEQAAVCSSQNMADILSEGAG